MREYRIGDYGIAQAYMAIVGILLVVAGLDGFVAALPLAGPDGVLPTNTIHDLVHLATGGLALYVAFGVKGEAQANGTIGFGVLYAAIFVLVILSPTLFGLFGDVPATTSDHVLHAVLAVVSLAVGYLSKGRTTVVASDR